MLRAINMQLFLTSCLTLILVAICSSDSVAPWDDSSEFIMVIGGVMEDGNFTDSIEILSADPEATPVPDCLQNLTFPMEYIGNAGGVLPMEGKKLKRA